MRVILLTRTRRAVRKAKGDFEPTKLIGGLPPLQLKDTILGTDSGAGEQDKGLHRTEHGLLGGETKRKCKNIPKIAFYYEKSY